MGFSRSKITVEKVRHGDLKDLEKIFTKEFGDEMNTTIIKQRLYRIRQFYYLLLPLSNISNWVNNLFNLYVIKVENAVAGFLQISYLTAQQMHLDYVAISRKYRGQGLGTLVLQELFEQIGDKNRCDIILEVKNENPARGLYERLGFTVQAHVLHYEKRFGGTHETTKQPETAGPNLRKITAADRPLLYQLYCASLPYRLQRIVKRSPDDYRPSLFVRNLTWIKNHLMRAEGREFVAYHKEKLIAFVELRSYPKAAAHMLSVMLHSGYESFRENLMRQILIMLEEKQGEGKANTTIYGDSAEKQQVLERLGFVNQEQYFLMLRPAGKYRKHIKKPLVKPDLYLKLRKRKSGRMQRPGL